MNAVPSDLIRDAQALVRRSHPPDPRLAQDLRRGLARRRARADARDRAAAHADVVRRRGQPADHRLRHLRPVHRSRGHASTSPRACRALRARWIEERGDTEVLAGLSSEFGRAREHDPRLRRRALPGRILPRRARAGANVTQMHYARRGIVTPEMEFVAIRENQRIDAMREARLLSSTPARIFGARSRSASRRNSCATKSRAAARSSRTTSTTPKASR